MGRLLIRFAGAIGMLVCVLGVVVAVGAVNGDGVFLPLVVWDVPAATVTPTLEPTATPTMTVTPLPTVTSTAQPPGGCSVCSANVYNCSDFSTQAGAQACHDYCWGLVGFDVHELDSDGDGEACESLPLVFGGWVFGWR
jgi:hypothetical protein